MKKVYILINPDNNRIKIGITENIKQRLQTLRNESGCDIFLFYLSPWVSCAHILEEDTHRQFAKNRYIGEWFDLEPEKAMAYIQKHMANFRTYGDEEYQIKNEEYQTKIKKEKKERKYKNENDEEKVLDEPLTRFKSIGNNVYVRKNTEIYYQIRYVNKQWLIKKIRK